MNRFVLAVVMSTVAPPSFAVQPSTTTSSPATTRAVVPQTLAGADDLAMSGEYELAMPLYERLATEQPEHRLAAIVGISGILEMTGRYREGLERLEALRSVGQKDAHWLVARARLLELTGRYDEAIRCCQAAMELDREDYEARYRLGRLYEITGRPDQAVRVYKFFDDLAHERLPERLAQLVWHARGFYRSTVLTANPNLPDRARYILHELLQPIYERKDPRYWPALVASGELLLEKYNTAQAKEDFEAALTVNPKLVAARVGLAMISLEAWQFEKCEQQLRQTLKINPNSVLALNAMAQLRLTERKYRQAAEAAENALKVNPNDVGALSLAAASQMRLGDEAAARAYEEQAAKINPRCAMLHHTLAEWLSAGRQFPQAEQRYLKAIEYDPTWAEPQTALGLMYMQWGQEAKARTILDRSWQLDRFNAKTFNVRELLKQIEGFKRFESPHFILKLDEKQDAVLGPYFTEYLESIWPGLCRDFGHTPTEKVIVEVFPSHYGFSVRITSRPWIHTIGACTGRVIAMDAPRKKASLTGPFDWARVLRHELTHSITLSATENRITHWLTEGLAVQQENTPRSLRWMEMLSAAVRTGRLHTLDDIDWAFARPRRPNDRELAYAQSEWMIEYLVADRGFSSITKMLELLRQGKTQIEVIREVSGSTPEEFHAKFRRWAVEQVRGWGLPTAPIPPITQLRSAVIRKPNDAAALAALGEALLYDGEVKEADECVRKALESDPNCLPALSIRCELLMAGWEQVGANRSARQRVADEAEPLLARLLELDKNHRVGVRFRTLLLLEADDLDAAAPWVEKLNHLSPLDPVAQKGLAALHVKNGRKAEAVQVLSIMATSEEHDSDLPIRIADLCSELNRDAEAARWLVRAIQIDPYRVETHEELGELSLRLGNIDQAIGEYRALTVLDPQSADHFARLAMCYKKKGQTEDARSAARRAVELDAASPVQEILKGTR